MNLLLIRHGEQQAARFGADPGLTELGRSQAVELARHLASERIDAICVSPLRRAQQTAGPLAEVHGLEPVLHPSLQELGRGDLTDPQLHDAVAQAVLQRGWEQLRGGATAADGLDLTSFGDRVHAAVEGIIATHRGLTVAVVCHGGVINSYLATVLGLRRPMWFEPRHGSVQRVRASTAGHRTLLTLNELAPGSASLRLSDG